MVAGMDTTTLIVSHATRYLAQHPDWLQALWEEQERLMAEFGTTIDRRVCRPGSHLSCQDACASVTLITRARLSPPLYVRSELSRRICMVLDLFVTFFPDAVRPSNQDSKLSPSELSR